MPIKLFICFFAFNIAAAQINGEFWWLNNELAKLKNVEPPRPKFDDIGQFDTDDSAKVVFRDNVPQTDVADISTIPDTTTATTNEIEAIIYFKDDSKISTALYVNNKAEVIVTDNNKIDSDNETESNRKKIDEDIFNFEFPNDEKNIENNVSKVTTTSPENYDGNNINKSEVLNNKILFDTEDAPLSENICTYMKKSECDNCNGLSYIPESESNAFTVSTNSQNICCILPLTKRKSSKIYFPDSIFYKNRLKRSEGEKSASPALKQRQRLMQRKYGSETSDRGPATITSQKIVTTDEEYVDPYWNIKNSKLKHEEYETGSTQEYNNDYVYNDYYAAELPKPSLVGLYSDHRPTSWTFIHPHKGSSYGNDKSSELEIGSSGYSTIDPRLGGSSSSIVPNLKRRLSKLSTGSENMLNLESHTVSYHSNPDFQVLQGFKLLNLMDKKSSRPIPYSRRSTTESPIEIAEEGFESSVDNDYDDYMESTEKLYKNCGRTKGAIRDYNCESQLGELSRGAHPWLLLAVLTKRQQSILCYATLIHPRAAVTAADCTYGMSPGEITIIAGAWDLKERRSSLQYRVVSVHENQQYTPGKLAYNIALLYWRRPLRLDSHVQPACIADANVGVDCMFVGWGGYDQGVRRRPRWQRASILSPKNCDELISTHDDHLDLPIDMLCASVESETTVTGPGGPLLCKVEDVFSMAGFAVWRNNVVILMRAQEWTARAMAALRIH